MCSSMKTRLKFIWLFFYAHFNSEADSENFDSVFESTVF